jgi:threonine dehydratase
MIGIAEIEQARRRIGDAIVRTPCTHSARLSQLCGARVFLKLENLQRTGSFKERGALNRLLTLSQEQRARGIVSASAGNHAQALAFRAGALGIPSTLVMPVRTPLVKLANTREYGAEVILEGDDFAAAYARAEELERERGLVFVPPFEDERIIAGQGTIGLELLEQVPDLEVVVVAIGGGGLISGIALACKERRPAVKVIGVEAAALPSMLESLHAGEVVTLPPAQTIADGIAVKRPGKLTLEYVRRYVDGVVTVDDEEIASAILLLLEREKTVVEGAGAAPVAALRAGRVPEAEGKTTVLVLGGGNIDVNLLSRIIERGLAKDGRLIRLEAKIEDRPGALARLLELVAAEGGNVLEVHHDRTFSRAALDEVEVELTLETRGREHVERLVRNLRKLGFRLERAATRRWRRGR